MRSSVNTGRAYWHDALMAGGFTAIPRWTRNPHAGVAECQTAIPQDLVSALRRLADELDVSLSSIFLAAHAKVLAALSGEPEVATGYVATEGGRALLCRITTEPESWRALLLDVRRVELELLVAQGVSGR